MCKGVNFAQTNQNVNYTKVKLIHYIHVCITNKIL